MSSSPSPQAGSPISISSLSSYLNHPVRLHLSNTTPPSSTEGILFTIDLTTQCIVLTTPDPSSSSSTRTYSFHRLSSVSSVTLLSALPDASLPPLLLNQPNLPELRMRPEDLHARVEKAVAEQIKARARKGKGVTKEAQDLFDGLARTLPVRWHGTQIIVMDQVIISSPYTLNEVKGEKGAGERVERVKKVLEGERQRRAANLAG